MGEGDGRVGRQRHGSVDLVFHDAGHGVDRGYPKYQAVAEYVRSMIRGGSWAPGDKVPSVRELSEQFGATPTTVNNALRELKREGTVVGRQGAGTYVAEPAPSLISALERTAHQDEGEGWFSYAGPLSRTDAQRMLDALSGDRAGYQ